jgi:hypothetical protein
MAKGGKREGAGRPRLEESMKFKLQSYFTEQEVEDFVARFKVQAKKNPIVLGKLIEQLFGKAPQRMEVVGDPEKPIPLLHVLPLPDVLHNDGHKENSGAQ